jgi:hypothetical protein
LADCPERRTRRRRVDGHHRHHPGVSRGGSRPGDSGGGHGGGGVRDRSHGVPARSSVRLHRGYGLRADSASRGAPLAGHRSGHRRGGRFHRRTDTRRACVDQLRADDRQSGHR